MSDRAAPVLVAPRELTDLVYRCARTAGVQAGVARRLAVRWTDAAIDAAGASPADAASQGLAVDRAAFDCLCQSAEAFLVSEQLLDEIADA